MQHRCEENENHSAMRGAAFIFMWPDFVNVQWSMLLLALRFLSSAHHLQVRFTLPELG